MPKLTPEGVAEVSASLYSMTDAELIAQTDQVASDYVSWMTSRFELTAAQIEYLASAPHKVQKLWGYALASTLITRGPIVFPALPSNPEPRRAKELRQNLFGDVSYDDDSKVIDGAIQMTISSRLL